MQEYRNFIAVSSFGPTLGASPIMAGGPVQCFRIHRQSSPDTLDWTGPSISHPAPVHVVRMAETADLKPPPPGLGALTVRHASSCDRHSGKGVCLVGRKRQLGLKVVSRVFSFWGCLRMERIEEILDVTNGTRVFQSYNTSARYHS
jgi:hypothetical protein